jgi:hypothetical protein
VFIFKNIYVVLYKHYKFLIFPKMKRSHNVKMGNSAKSNVKIKQHNVKLRKLGLFKLANLPEHNLLNYQSLRKKINIAALLFVFGIAFAHLMMLNRL